MKLYIQSINNYVVGSDILAIILGAQATVPLTDDELRILNIVLSEYSTKLKEEGLDLESAISEQHSITKERVVSCLQGIGQGDLGTILSKKQGEC